MTQPRTESGIAAVEAMFRRAEAQNRAAFMPFFPIGYPDYEQSIDMIEAMAAQGVDGFEIGVPFSDPVADGPIIQAAAMVALENGVNVRKVLAAIQTLRERGVQQPMFVFSYLNPLLAFGVEEIVNAAKAVGADGFIIPDLPPEEAAMFKPYCDAAGMALVFFLAPTSNPKRIEAASQNATGFIYVVSVMGITGVRKALPTDLTEFIGRLREHTDKPLVLGFGISTAEQAQRMNGLLNGFIVGSAFVRSANDGIDAVRTLAETLRRALD